jgi:putative ABC transport system permease protein
VNWWHRLLRRNQMEEQLDKELRFHLDQHAADLVTRGCAPDEARRLARLALGGAEQVKEKCRDARGTRWLEDLFQDLRYAIRTLRQKPGFTLVALLTLALGIGTTTVMFTIVDGVLLRPLPYSNPQQLVELWEKTTWSTQFGNLWSLTYPNYLDCSRQVHSLEMAAFHGGGGIVSAPGPAQYVHTMEISSELFKVLGVEMAQGRAFSPDEDRPGGTPVSIISYRFWQSRFGGNPAAVGMTLVYNGQHTSIVGITPPEFRLDGLENDLFTPIGQDTSPLQLNREAHGTAAWARLRPGATLAQANSELAVVGHQLEAKYPKANHGRTFFAEPLRPDVTSVRSTLWLLLGAVSLVLLIACANVASLLLARSVSRQRELAMRAALGASQWRLVRQSLTESVVLGLCGGSLGILLAVLGVPLFTALWPGSLPRAEQIQIDGNILLFAVGVSLASALIFGLAPALRSRSTALEETLRAGARSITGHSRRMHATFVVAEISLSVVLLVSAGMLGRTLIRLSSLNPGVNIKNLTVARVALSPDILADIPRTRAAWKDILERASEVPGVQSVALIDTVPMRPGSNQIPYSTTPTLAADGRAPIVLADCTTPDYLKVTGIPLREGRFLTRQDRMGAELAAVIDDVMREQAFPDQDPIGKHIWIRWSLGSAPVAAKVVGVVGHVRQWGLAGDDRARVRAQLYYSFDQVPDELMRRWSELMSIAVRTGPGSRGVLEALRAAVRGVTNDQVLYQPDTMEQLAGDSVSQQRFLLSLFGIFASLALLLACIGIYGVLAYLTNQRVPEIGVRMALGARAHEVMFLVLRQSLAMIFAGVGLGIVGAIGAGQVLIRLVEGMQFSGPWTFVVMTSVLVVAALFASFLPARRASRIDPMKALRQE